MILPGKQEMYREMFRLLEEIEETSVLNNTCQIRINDMCTELDKMISLTDAVPLIYVAGQYFPDTKIHGENAGIKHWEMHKNIERARLVGAQCVVKGWMPIIPHTNTAWMSGLAIHHWWYIATNEQLRVCDAIVMVEGWEASHGAQMELDEANRMGLNVWMNIEDVPEARFKQVYTVGDKS